MRITDLTQENHDLRIARHRHGSPRFLAVRAVSTPTARFISDSSSNPTFLAKSQPRTAPAGKRTVRKLEGGWRFGVAACTVALRLQQRERRSGSESALQMSRTRPPKAPGSVTRLLDELRSEDAQLRNKAASALWETYCSALLGLACQNLDRRLKRRVGPEDIVQRTFKSFFLRQQRGQYDLADRHDLLRLLVRMTLNKARSTAAREGRGRRDYRREQTPTAVDAEARGTEAWLLECADRGAPTPDEAAALAEEAEQRLAQLPDDLYRVAQYKLEGYTNAEIAALPEMGCSVRTVERKLRLIREAWGVP
jgi:RNA polymerase sigma-70 factor, ECF subfamily